MSTSTTQRSTGIPTVYSNGFSSKIMVWTGTDGQNFINIASSTNDYIFSQGPVKSFTSNFGPAFVLLTDTLGYVIWTDATSAEITFTRAQFSNDVWSLDPAPTRIKNSRAASGPTAAMGSQNGHPVVNVIWQDSSLGSMAFTQILTFSGQVSFPITQLGASCIDSPALTSVGGVNYLAYFDKNKHFNLTLAPRTSLNFNFSNHFVSEDVTSDKAPALVSIANGLGYVCWNTPQGVTYGQIGLSATQSVKFNPAVPFQIIPDSNPISGIFAQRVSTMTDDIQSQKLLVAWSDSAGTYKGTVFTSLVAPDNTPVFSS